MKLNEEHYKIFKSSPHGVWPSSSSPLHWFRWVHDAVNSKYSVDLKPNYLNENKLTRIELFEIIKNPKVDTLSCCISILAWGGMNRKHGAEALAKYANWNQIADAIRNGSLDRVEAYEKFANLRLNSLLPGMGPAYFTKLIFFLLPTNMTSGLIMDQWTSASVNLLFGQRIIETQMQKYLQKNGQVRLSEIVSDQNTKENYLNFCNCVELIATNLKKDPACIEEMLFSQGRGNGEWRNHVVKVRKMAVG